MTIRFQTPRTRGDVSLVAVLVLCGLVVGACSLALWVAFIRWACR